MTGRSTSPFVGVLFDCFEVNKLYIVGGRRSRAFKPQSLHYTIEIARASAIPMREQPYDSYVLLHLPRYEFRAVLRKCGYQSNSNYLRFNSTIK
jgi:hypothetical protein